MKYFDTDRIVSNWVYGGFLCAFLLLGLLPVFAASWGVAMLCVFLQLPVYMLHQYEEHDNDRFRVFVNGALGGGKELLSRSYVFFVNVFGVWGVNLVSILLAFFFHVGFGLIGVYLVLVNAFAHVGQGVAMRRYNPGLVSAVVLFFPAGGVALWVISPFASLPFHLIGLASSIAIHASIVLHVAAKKRKN